jgi:hypothetical protein
MKTDRDEPDFKTMSDAVQAWYRFYELDPKDGPSDFYNAGHRTPGDIATALIGTYVGIHATRVNAPTSAAVH